MDEALFPIEVLQPIEETPELLADGELWVICGYYHPCKKWGYRVVTDRVHPIVYSQYDQYKSADNLGRAKMIGEAMIKAGWRFIKIFKLELKSPQVFTIEGTQS